MTVQIPEKYKLAFEVSPMPLLLAAPDGAILLTNPEFDTMFEYEPGSLIGRPVEVLMPMELRQAHPKLRNAFLKYPVNRHMGQGRDLQGVTQTGRILPLELGLKPVAVGEETWSLVTAIDISQRKAGQERLHVALDAAASAMLMIDGDGRIVFVNRAATVLFGYPEEELLGASIETLVPSDVRDHHHVLRYGFFENASTRAMGSGTQLYAERRDGSAFRVEVALTPVESGGDKLILATVIDLSERLAAERSDAERRAAEREAEKLARLNDQLSRFAYSASHDLKAPLASISGLLDLALDDLAERDLEGLRENVKAAIELSQSSARKVETVLSLARGSDASDGAETLDLSAIANDRWRHLADRDGPLPELTVEIGHKAPFIASADAIGVILENLLSNAAKFADTAKSQKWVRMTTSQQGADLLVKISDNGVGIPADRQSDVFGAFTRVDELAGDGIGLALVRQRVGELGGEISLESELGAGTSFELRLPMQEAA